MKTKSLTMQRQAARAMKDAMHIGVDPINSVVVQGKCFEQPGAVRLIRSFERKDEWKRKEGRRIYTRSHAIEVWDSENE